MAVHLLHKGHDGRLVVIAVLFETGVTNDALASLLPQMPAVKSLEKVMPALRVDATSFIPASHGYFQFDGSVTAPPCTEGVTWLVMKQPQQISADQLARLAGFFPANARAIQPLYNRTVKESL
jgi:carbonic anhydrase